VANDIGYTLNRLASRITGLSGVTAAQNEAMARSSASLTASVLANDQARAYSAYASSKAAADAQYVTRDAYLNLDAMQAEIANRQSLRRTAEVKSTQDLSAAQQAYARAAQGSNAQAAASFDMAAAQQNLDSLLTKNSLANEVDARKVAAAETQLNALKQVEASHVATAAQIADQNQYTRAMDAASQQRLAIQQKEEAARIASGQRIMNAFTQAGTLAVMSGAVMVGVAGAIAGGMAYAADQSAKFEQQLLLIRTQAGGTATDVNLLRQAALTLAPQFGFTAQAAATAAYHIESVGLRGAAAVDALKYSMMGAKIGMADLEATANMLSIIMASTLVPAGQSSEQTMATLDAIIGQGNMRMDDLSAAFRTGLVGAVQMAGVSLRDTGAALATLTDLGYTGASAGTALRSALTMIAAPSNKATELLKDMGFSVEEVSSGMNAMKSALLASGINVTQFAEIVRTQGISGGLQALHDAMVRGGLSADEMAATITKAFGGSRIGSAFKVLFENLDRLKMREGAIATNSTTAIFEQKWKATADLVTTKLAQLSASLTNLFIIIGEAVTPTVVEWIGHINDIISPMIAWVSANGDLIAKFAPLLVAVLAVGGAVLILAGSLTIIGTMIASLIGGLATFGPMALGVGTILIALGTLAATAAHIAQQDWRYFVEFWDGRVVPSAQRLWNTLKAVFDAIGSALATVRPLFTDAFNEFATQLTKNGGLWDSATSAFQNFSKQLLAFVKSDTFASLIADFAVTLPSALKIALDSAVLFGDALQLAFTTVATGVKVMNDELSGNFSQAAKDTQEGYSEINRQTIRFGNDWQKLSTDQAAMFDGTNQQMWQNVYNQTLAATNRLGDDGAVEMTKAHVRMTTAARAQMQIWKTQASVDGVTVGQEMGQGIVAGMQNEESTIYAELQGVAGRMRLVMARQLQSGSPSEVFAQLGESIPQGTVVGIERGQTQVESALTAMVTIPPVAGAAPGGRGVDLVSLLQQIRDGIVILTQHTDPANQPQTYGIPASTPSTGNTVTDSTIEALAYKMVADAQAARNRGIAGQTV